jgi:hypothetical protein
MWRFAQSQTVKAVFIDCIGILAMLDMKDVDTKRFAIGGEKG